MVSGRPSCRKASIGSLSVFCALIRGECFHVKAKSWYILGTAIECCAEGLQRLMEQWNFWKKAGQPRQSPLCRHNDLHTPDFQSRSDRRGGKCYDWSVLLIPSSREEIILCLETCISRLILFISASSGESSPGNKKQGQTCLWVKWLNQNERLIRKVNASVKMCGRVAIFYDNSGRNVSKSKKKKKPTKKTPN